MNAISTRGRSPAGIMPQSFEDVQRLARMAIASGLFKGDRKDDENAKLAKATMAIMQGLEVGLPPMQALQCIAIINGRCLIWGDAVPGLLWANGFKIEQSIEGVGDKRTASCTITRPDGTKGTRTFSVADAKRARLWDERPTVKRQWDGKWEEKPNDSPWFRFSDRMLAYRALGFCHKDVASDVTRGLYLKEEYDADDMVDVTPKASLVDDIPDIPETPEPVPFDPEATPDPLAEFEGDAESCGDMETLNEVWARFEIIFEDQPEVVMQRAVAIYNQHKKRVS